MASNPALEILTEGLSILTKQDQERREELTRRLQKQEKLTEEEEDWLDHEGNHVDEQRALNALKEAPDYDAALKQLGKEDQGGSVTQRWLY
ncbi:hypothetical protein FA15DRAFT_710633 [Coprinopsis marcescibilis]|uniref:Uncharacterized protein n=1 Tax=Coprinopsis marcescibilis TaxID=230819 RepID=A0A5C3KC19_COPMA|nr:hypothetical protein FA15DRAFT_710633 [Coprinopsis marcescibilis]